MSTSTDPSASPSSNRGVLGLAFLVAFLDIVGFSIIFPLFAHMLEHYVGLEGEESAIARLVERLADFAGGENQEFAVNALFGGVLGSLYSLLQFLFAPVWGGLSDRIGRRPTMIVTLVGTVLGYVLWTFAGTFALLVVARLVGGLMAGNLATVSAIVSDVTTPANRSKGMGLIGAAIGLGFVFGPAIGGVAHGHLDVAAWWPAGVEYGLNPFSGAALCALVLSLVNLVLFATRFRETKIADDPTVTRSANPLKLFRSVQAPGVPRTNLVYFCFLVAFSAIEFTLVFLTLERFAYEPLDNAKMFVFVGLLIAFVQGGAIRRLAPRFGDRRLALAGIVLVVPGFLAVGLATTQTVLYVGLGAMAVGSALAMPTLSSLVSRYAPRASQGLALGLFRSLGSLSRAVGPILGGLLYWQLGSQAAYLVAAGFLLVPVLGARGLPDPPEAV